MGTEQGSQSPGRILVTYASRTGTTIGVAEEIGRVLARSGTEVDVRPMDQVEDPTRHSAVVAGSGIQNRQWLPEGMQYVQTTGPRSPRGRSPPSWCV